MRGTLTGGSVGLLRYPAMLPCFSRLWGMILHCRKSPCRLEITADSRGLASGFSCLGDHPRVCGEHSRVMKSRSNCGGSSPRMRGTPIACRILSAPAGIIPAYAGNTARYRNLRKLYWDHPRVCGEHRPVSESAQTLLGSSPRMRGTPAAWPARSASKWIIPAYAGNTICRFRSNRDRRDHPRVCGEHSTTPVVTPKQQGSSPRMRGTPASSTGNGDGTGIIPAYAGNTRHQHVLRLSRGIIPAYAGNTAHPFHGGYRRPGSSPRMRGTPDLHNKSVVCIGIIPAYAGNTSPLSRP